MRSKNVQQQKGLEERQERKRCAGEKGAEEKRRGRNLFTVVYRGVPQRGSGDDDSGSSDSTTQRLENHPSPRQQQKAEGSPRV